MKFSTAFLPLAVATVAAANPVPEPLFERQLDGLSIPVCLTGPLTTALPAPLSSLLTIVTCPPGQTCNSLGGSLSGVLSEIPVLGSIISGLLGPLVDELPVQVGVSLAMNSERFMAEMIESSLDRRAPALEFNRS